MLDLLFIEIGAVVTEVLDTRRCTIQPFCTLDPPKYDPKRRVEVDFARSLASALSSDGRLDAKDIAALRAPPSPSICLYDVIDNHPSKPIGLAWPGGGYEGVASIREDVVKANPTLADAVKSHLGQPWEYQVVVSIDEATGAIRRYHGFHAKVVETKGKILVLEVFNTGRSMIPGSNKRLEYDPANTKMFYTGKLVAEHVVRAGQAPGSYGAVFIAVEAALTDGPSLPKLPPSAGAPASAPGGHAGATEAPSARGYKKTVIAMPDLDPFEIALEKLIEGESKLFLPGASNTPEAESLRQRLVHHIFDGAKNVELVGHSTPIEGYLQLGEWVLDPQQIKRLASYMPESVKSVSLIGCATAGTPKGRDAADTLAQSGRATYGTMSNVYTTHFDKHGVKRFEKGGPELKEFLPHASDTQQVLPPMEPAHGPAPSPCVRFAPGLAAVPPEPAAEPGLLARLGRTVWSVIAVLLAVFSRLLQHLLPAREVPHRQILRFLSHSTTPMPGLLTRPLLTYQITSGGKEWTLEILFDFKYARLYPSASPDEKGRVYDIRGFGRSAKTPLEVYLERATRPDPQSQCRVTLGWRHQEAGNRGERAAA